MTIATGGKGDGRSLLVPTSSHGVGRLRNHLVAPSLPRLRGYLTLDCAGNSNHYNLSTSAITSDHEAKKVSDIRKLTGVWRWQDIGWLKLVCTAGR